MSQKTPRKRGANYTLQEKSLLLDLIVHFRNIVDSKRTDGIMVQKKKEAWAAITSRYNSNCSSGPRDMDQLRVLYDNLKQKSRRKTGEKHNASNNQASEISMSEEDVIAKLNIKDEKKEINEGVGYWKPKASENNTKYLTIVQGQIEPLCNPFDSAAGFFNDTSDMACTGQTNTDTTDTCKPPWEEPVEQASIENNMITCPERLPSPEILIETPEREVIECHDKGVKRKELETTSDSTRRNSRPAHSKMQHNRKVVQRKIFKSSTQYYKKLYFMKKCHNAELEKKKLMLEIIHMKKEHELRMQLLKKKTD